MKTRIDTSIKHDTRNKYALFCVQPAFDIRSELNKMKSIKHNVVKADDNIIITSVSDNRKHVVDNSFSNCSCSVWGNYGLNKMESIKHNVVKADDNIIITSVSDNRKHVVDNSFSNCSCSVWGNYGLPCRRIFVCRKNESKNLYDGTLVDAMWRKDLAPNEWYVQRVFLTVQ